MFYFLQEWLFFVLAHLGRIVCDLLAVILSPVILFYDKKLRGFGRKSFKNILITGGSSAIGGATALRLAKPGVTLILTGRNESRLARMKDKCTESGATVVVKCVDVTDAEAMKEFIYEMDDAHPLDLVIANAGAGYPLMEDKHYSESAKIMVDTNISGVLNTILPAISRMQDRKCGHVAMIGSLSAYLPTVSAGFYMGTKVAIRYLAEDLAPQLKFWNIDCSYVMPGYVDSGSNPAAQCKDKCGFMDSDSAAHYIVDGLETRQIGINFPLKAFVPAWIVGSLHPMVVARINERRCTRNYAFDCIARRIEFDPNDEFGGEC